MPLEPGHVTIYTCGPTVYSYAHIGNFRSFLFADLMRRTFERLGFSVRHVMNITDVGHMTEDHLADAEGEDKLAKAAREHGWDPFRVARYYEDAFAADARALRLKNYLGAEGEDPELHPRATEHVAEMLVMIDRLIERDYAYVDSEGQVYFHVARFPEYGKLSGKRLDDLEVGARVEVREEKRDPRDFALWKVDTKHLMQWDPHSDDGWPEGGYERLRELAPDGIDPRIKKGFPGWHIECSAMSATRLSEHIDIHTGGEDNIFPHHECEIAQSYGACTLEPKPETFARYWVHGRHLLVNNAKMSKSAGTFFTTRDLTHPMESERPEIAEQLRAVGFEEGRVPTNVLRYALLSVAYPQPLNFTFDLLVQSRQSLERLTSLYLRVNETAAPGKVRKPIKKLIAESDAELDEALCDNLNSSRALAAVFGLVSAVNRDQDLTPGDAAAVRDFLEGVNHIFDALETSWRSAQLTNERLDALAGETADRALEELLESEDPATLPALLARRRQARLAKEFSTSDAIRDRLQARGVQVQDLADGVRYRYKQMEA